MVKRETNHFFKATLPKLGDDEEEIFYNHPIYDLKCNQLGVVYPGPEMKHFSYTIIGDRYLIGQGSNRKSSMINNLLYQCYTGNVDKAMRKIYPLDGNLLNKTPDNIVYPPSLKKIAIENYNIFIDNTLQYMLARDKELKEKGIDPQLYWGIQKLIPDIKNPYTKMTGIKIVYDGGGLLKVDNGERVGEVKEEKKRNSLSKEELDRRTLYTLKARAEGQTELQIAKTFGVSITNVQFYKRRKLSTDK